MAQGWDTFKAQLIQWPPTSTTIHAAAAVGFLISWFVTGSWEWATGAAATLAWVLPQDAPAIQKALDDDRTLTTAPKA